jgi:hypothetical protein
MNMDNRVTGYRFQNGGRDRMTPKQMRRIKKKDVCPKCPARGVDDCETDSGNKAKQPHVGRYKQTPNDGHRNVITIVDECQTTEGSK